MEKPDEKLGGGFLSSLSDFVPPWLDLRNTLSSGFFLLAGLIAALVFGWILFPMILYSKQPQPMNFNHVVHLNEESGIDGETETEKCLYCHEFREDGSFAGIPKIAKCIECHDDPESSIGETLEEKEFLHNHVAEEKEISWFSYYRQPDCVYFSHIAHVNMGKQECFVCHGDHGKSEKIPVYQQNRLTGYSINIWGKRLSGWKTNTWDRMKMDDCAECHTRTGHEENNACFVCHK